MDQNGVILAVDSATEHCSVALSSGGNLLFRSLDQPREHARALLPMVAEVLEEGGRSAADVDLFAYSRGPGSFTGLRIGISVIQGLAYGCQRPTLGISTLACQAAAAVRLNIAGDGDRVYSLIDARMDEIYWACFDIVGDKISTVGSEEVCSPAEWVTELDCSRRLVGVGSGWRYLKQMADKLPLAFSDIADAVGPSALDLLTLVPGTLAQVDPGESWQAQPVYLREEIAWKKLHEQGRP